VTGERFDAVIVGSGAGGGTMAFALARAGARVLLLEAGPRYVPERDYRLHLPGWEQSPFPDRVDPGPRQTYAPLQALDGAPGDLRSWNHLRGRLVSGARRVPWGYVHAVGLGGSTLRYTGEAHRLHPGAMAMRSRFGVAADWPLDYAELEPYYLDAERHVGVAGAGGDPVRWRSAPYPLPPHPMSHASRRIGAGAARLGLTWTPNPLAVLSRPRAGRPACNYCGQCGRGCPRRDKGSVDVTWIAAAEASGRCTVRTGCAVTRVEAGPGDRVRAVHFRDEHGRDAEALGAVVIVAAGAVETPRLLLASGGPHAPGGLANESGEVGRNFMETLSWTASGLHPERLGSHRGLPADAICWDHNAPDAIAGVIGGCRFTQHTAEADLAGPIAYARRVVGGWGAEHKQRMRDTFGRVLSVGAIGESLPHPQSRVDLDPSERDAAGVPKARIHSHVDAAAVARLRFMADTCRAILDAAGVDALFEEVGTLDVFNATHVSGTCRMGADPATSVVDAHCRSHRWRNLYVVDASVFPSSGGGEGPALTVQALALRAARHVARALAAGEA